MKPKKPDRFERIVGKLTRQYDSNDGEGLCLMTDLDNVTKLLRREHQAVVKMVKNLPMYIDKTGNHPEHYVSVNDLLDCLTRRAT